MLVKLSGNHVKFSAAFAIVGLVGVLAYLMIKEQFVENTTVTVYEVAKLVKRESHSNPLLLSGHLRNQGTQTAETSKRETSEASESPTSSGTHLTDAHFNAGDSEGIDDSGEASSDIHDVGDSSANPQISAEVLRRLTLQNRQIELIKQTEAMAREDGSFSPENTLKVLELHEENLRIAQELGTLISDDGIDRLGSDIDNFMASHTTKDGKVPVFMGLQLADMFEEGGHLEFAKEMRMVTQHALQKGDEVL